MAAHRASWFPSWWCFQVVAVAVGASIVRRRSFFVAVATAAVGAVLVANGASFSRWIASGFHGAAPELEVAGFGALAGLIAGFVVAARRSADATRALAVAIGPMLSIARLGCFFAGCDFGAPATVPWALRYSHWTPAFAAQLDAKLIDVSSAMTLPVHPTQLYESALGVVIFLVARRRPSLSLVVAMYAVGRFAIDFFRGDQGHGALGLTTSQLLALAALGLVISRMARRSASLPRECAGPRS
jgi:prolipoprotein diacylglyceryltransferase